MKTSEIKVIGETFERISDMVTPTMGAKGRMAVLKDEMGRPFLTDDGVTVAKECLHMEGFEQMVAMSMCEAASNTERKAFDGTTLTILLTNELYKAGREMIEGGMHPQMAADTVLRECSEAMGELEKLRIIPKEGDAKTMSDVAVITTKMPYVGELVAEAYGYAGKPMNVIVEHERSKPESHVEHVDGMVVDSGYFTESLRQLCGEDGRWEAEDCLIAILSEGILTPVGIRTLFGSIKDPNRPILFVVGKGFQPESMRLLMDMLVQNKLRFMFTFVNDSREDEVFLDIAARTGGRIQAAEIGTTDYSMDDAGVAEKVTVEIDKTTIIAKGDAEAIAKRVASYAKELEDDRFTMGFIRKDVVTRRMSNLTVGVTKIMLAAQTVTEFRTIRMKIDDAVGAVRCAAERGILPGGGKALYLVAEKFPEIAKAFRKPAEKIIENSGLKVIPKVLEDRELGLDVNTGKVVNLLEAGIVDSYESIATALRNAASIASSYLRAYILIKND